MSIDYEAATELIKLVIDDGSEPEFAREVIKAALGDTVLYEHDGEIRNDSIGLPLTPFDCVQNAIEWGMVQVWPESSE